MVPKCLNAASFSSYDDFAELLPPPPVLNMDPVAHVVTQVMVAKMSPTPTVSGNRDGALRSHSARLASLGLAASTAAPTSVLWPVASDGHRSPRRNNWGFVFG